MKIRSISFDTSFLLHHKPEIDTVIRILLKDRILSDLFSRVLQEEDRDEMG